MNDFSIGDWRYSQDLFFFFSFHLDRILHILLKSFYNNTHDEEVASYSNTVHSISVFLPPIGFVIGLHCLQHFILICGQLKLARYHAELLIFYPIPYSYMDGYCIPKYQNKYLIGSSSCKIQTSQVVTEGMFFFRLTSQVQCILQLFY